MPFAMHLPLPPPHGLVAVAVGYRVPANPTGLHRGLPSRHRTLVLELRAPLRVSGEAGQVVAHGVVGGLHTRPAIIDASNRPGGLQYALAAPAAHVLLGVPAAELRGSTVDLADLLGLSERFRSATGVTPKEAARIARFEAARDLLLAGHPSPADVAARCGYADQSHLAREWRSFAGCSLGTWLREEFPFHDSVPVDAAGSPA